MQDDSFHNIILKDGQTQELFPPVEGTIEQIRNAASQHYPNTDPSQLVLVRDGSLIELDEDSIWFQNNTTLVMFPSQDAFHAYLEENEIKRSKSSANNPHELWVATLRLQADHVEKLLQDPSMRTNVDVIPKGDISTLATHFIRLHCPPLMVALAQWKKDPKRALAIVAALLKAGATIFNIHDNNSWTVLHYAAYYSDACVAMILHKGGIQKTPRTSEGHTPLHLLCNRYDVGPGCIEYFCQKDSTLTPWDFQQAFHLACRYSNQDMVACLYPYYRKVGGAFTAEQFWTCLLENEHFGNDILHAMQNEIKDIKVGEDPKFQQMLRDGRVITAAIFARYADHCYLRPSVPDALVALPAGTCFMPLLLAARKTGWYPITIDKLVKKGPRELLHAALQLGLKVGDNVHRPREKHAIIQKDCATRKAAGGNTELHIAVASGNVQAVKACCAKFANPFVANYNRLFPIQLTTVPEIQAILRSHMSTKAWLNDKVIQWYGPYFERLVRAFRFVQQWHARRGNPYLPRDMSDLILDHVARFLFPFEALM